MSITNVAQIDYWNPTLWEFTFGDDFTDVKFYVKNISIPFITLEKEQRNTGYSYYTGYTPEDDFSITFLDNSSLDVYNYLRTWHNDIFDYKKRVFKRRGNHTKNGILLIQKDEDIAPMFNAKTEFPGARNTIKRFDFINMMLLSIDSIDLDYEDGEAKEITANFECDAVNDNLFQFSDIITVGNRPGLV